MNSDLPHKLGIKLVYAVSADEGLSIGGRVEKGEIPKVKLQANKNSKADK